MAPHLLLSSAQSSGKSPVVSSVSSSSFPTPITPTVTVYLVLSTVLRTRVISCVFFARNKSSGGVEEETRAWGSSEKAGKQNSCIGPLRPQSQSFTPLLPCPFSPKSRQSPLTLSIHVVLSAPNAFLSTTYQFPAHPLRFFPNSTLFMMPKFQLPLYTLPLMPNRNVETRVGGNRKSSFNYQRGNIEG